MGLQSALLEKQNHESEQTNLRLEKMVDERTRNLKRANRELDLFLYQSSHALREPLMRIMGLLSIIRTESDPKVLAVMNDKVDYTIKSMDRMLHKLMDITEIQRRNLHPEPLALLPLIQNHIAEIENDMNYAPASIELNVPPQMFLVPEKYMLNVVLRNLLENALHFRVPGRTHKLQLSIHFKATELFIRVWDNGMGIPKDHLVSVFSMFFRGTA